jgi:phosphoribosyl 1,2-cyclic phosphodiesterase
LCSSHIRRFHVAFGAFHEKQGYFAFSPSSSLSIQDSNIFMGYLMTAFSRFSLHAPQHFGAFFGHLQVQPGNERIFFSFLDLFFSKIENIGDYRILKLCALGCTNLVKVPHPAVLENIEDIICLITEASQNRESASNLELISDPREKSLFLSFHF